MNKRQRKFETLTKPSNFSLAKAETCTVDDPCSPESGAGKLEVARLETGSGRARPVFVLIDAETQLLQQAQRPMEIHIVRKSH
jgi:hypothetical protein